MVSKDNLLKLFRDSKRSYSIERLVSHFKVSFKNVSLLLDMLYELENEGKIFFNEEKKYIVVDGHFFYKFGELCKSKRNKYYISLGPKSRIMIKTRNVQDMNAEVGDKVFVEETLLPNKRINYKERSGKIVRTVTKNDWCNDETFVTSTAVYKDYALEEYYIIRDDVRIPISYKNMNGAFENDFVNVNIRYNSQGIFAKVLGVLKKYQDEKVFVLHNKKWVSLENDKAIGCVKDNNISDVTEGQRILAHYEYDEKNKIFNLTDARLLSRTSVNDDIIAFALNNNVHKDFPAHIEKEAEKLHITVKMKEDRRDERDRVTFTIDPTYAKDLDDAVSIKKINSEEYELRVDIVDTTPFVPFNSPLFKESMTRGTSYYLSNMVFPELPSCLSNKVCSLNPGEEKLTRTFMIKVNSSGEILDYDIYNSIVKSKIKMNYDAANDYLEKSIIPKGYYPFRKDLFDMYDLSTILQKRRLDRGFLILDTREKKFVVNMDGTPVSVEEEKRGLANILIENFMILAGEVASDYAYFHDLPFVYRNHECPDLSKVIQAEKKFPKSVHVLNNLKNIRDVKDFSRYMNRIMKNATDEEYVYYSKILLSAMKRAYYSDDPLGHWAMALERYATVTSTMRRGPDQLNHLVLDEAKYHRFGNVYMNSLRDYIHNNCLKLSQAQQKADKLERDVSWFLLCCYAESLNGETIEATIEFISPEGLSLKTDTNIPGFIPLSKEFVYDANKNIVKNKSFVYQVGDRVLIRVIPHKIVKDALLFEISSEKSYKRVLRKGEF